MSSKPQQWSDPEGRTRIPLGRLPNQDRVLRAFKARIPIKVQTTRGELLTIGHVHALTREDGGVTADARFALDAPPDGSDPWAPFYAAIGVDRLDPKTRALTAIVFEHTPVLVDGVLVALSAVPVPTNPSTAAALECLRMLSKALKIDSPKAVSEWCRKHMGEIATLAENSKASAKRGRA